MIDWDTLIVYVLGGISGVIVTFILTWVSDWRRRQNNVDQLRRLSYSDILRIFSNLSWLDGYISTDLKARKLNFDDASIAKTWLSLYQSYLDKILDDDWYKQLRAESLVFSSFTKEEKTAMNAIYELLSLTVGGRIYEATMEVFDKIERPRNRIIKQGEGVSNIVNELQNFIRSGLNEEVLLAVATHRDKWHIAMIFHRREIEEMLSKAVQQGIISLPGWAGPQVDRDFLGNIGEQFVNKQLVTKQKQVLSQCWNCRRYDSGTCAAFPKGIPEDILCNRFLHTKEYSGDRGIRYDPLDKTSINFAEKEAPEK
jgi:hypothetical protein